jgi:hypothetical protein
MRGQAIGLMAMFAELSLASLLIVGENGDRLITAEA